MNKNDFQKVRKIIIWREGKTLETGVRLLNLCRWLYVAGECNIFHLAVAELFTLAENTLFKRTLEGRYTC